ncbi:MAG: phenylalanine--tRNA ligase subunit alpha [Candidatus Korarchaeota archaeon]|nr:phenylalanine--tRNA ligase subunit alpha [Candidatus Korarchaeota archaeon]NIU84857.1 phenylalanine--tRNA ligase subunit alpha [Candidatus Thorarchaeota archaeon]NIW14894.1 phenylalanine--tRNA ligase subunit alpha [Candidatus Thorarchaeota archaeon]NIW52531.1 phenylalanine--tRNA ligase subunit alpha [Candidatus Korarchaeota archaeon]
MRTIELKTYEKEVLAFLAEEGKSTVDEIAKGLNLKTETVNSVCESLKATNLIDLDVKKYDIMELTKEGKTYRTHQLPERKILTMIDNEVELTELQKCERISKKDLEIGLGWLKRKGIIDIDGSTVKRLQPKEDVGTFPEEKVIETIFKHKEMPISNLSIENAESIVLRLKRRNLVNIREKKTRQTQLTDLGRKVSEGKIKIKKPVSTLNSEMITKGSWKDVELSEYDVSLPSYNISPGKTHPYRQLINDLRKILIGMGFQERKGPFVELNFWNCDALFMPSDHPARDVHDIFLLKNPPIGDLPNEELWKPVKETHENGWNTQSEGWGFWDAELAKKLVLRSHTTAVSVRSLAEISEEELPVKIFTIDRNFRPDVIDPNHFIEFYQCEGIVVGEDLTFRHLLWYLKRIANELGFADEDVWFKPGYFPFTEPSVEGFVKIPDIGWVETLPGGIFRPEVTKPLGIETPVLAWGIGIDRLAMKKLDVYDLREVVFTSDLGELCKRKSVNL